ncbi:hypothetical protein EST38_g7602 [Candolleomyces aberdarensis]|uniref:BTB domain-containing protein n=1 Tax=Candolleomyces aberdarensis TaxID=2316362 RepID=A0A4Q2DHK6_9AGAR|nr:hypothetical protein EST38_g7602 [Candolleomyces aberdarensis]
MSNTNASGKKASATISRPKPIRWGGTVFFKSAERSQVEEIVFEAPRYRFTEHSEVFEDMFHLPTGSNGDVEGRDEEHPIVLDGYKANDFSALMKVLYPEPHIMVSGSYGLSKEEWVGVLALSTIWQMKAIREYAIGELGKLYLDPVDKAALGREHKVAKWFREGLNELISENPIRPLADIKARLASSFTYTCKVCVAADAVATLSIPTSATGVHPATSA